MNKIEKLKHNGWQTVVSFDQAIHCFIVLIISIVFYLLRKEESEIPLAWADETLSSRVWRLELAGICSWPRKVVDFIFFGDKDHCRKSYESERTGRQLPPELR